MNKKEFTITGIDCAHCASKVENKVAETIGNKNVSFITTYGTYVVPSDSLAFTTFLQTQTYEVIGYLTSSQDWSVDADIISYGLFNREFNIS